MILTKGGIWTNMEDEILKVAVMKYGEKQWRRISFLLSSSFFSKSAMQCKARWYEWTRQEDHNLLHDVKISTPGERDSNNPESKPDHVDMEAYELQTLSKARARLCNTRGNKGMRKAREKQLEEGRTLAFLQKRRELNAAGVDDDANKKRKVKGTIDYNAEVLFQKKPPLGFFDVTEECYTVLEPKFATTTKELEGEKRLDKEARLRKGDAERNKTPRQDVPSAILQADKLNDQETVRKRPKINLPAPQILDHQLKHIAKLRFGPSTKA